MIGRMDDSSPVQPEVRITPRLVTRTAALALAVFATLVAGSAVAGVL